LRLGGRGLGHCRPLSLVQRVPLSFCHRHPGWCGSGAGRHACVGNADHVASRIVRWRRPGCASRIIDVGDFVHLVGESRLIQFPRAVAVVLFECFPVAGGIQSPLLLKRAAGDRGLSAVERAAFLIR